MSQTWAEYLKQFQKSYEEAEVMDVYEDIPDGVYAVRVNSVRIRMSKTNRPMLEWELAIIEGKYVGRKEWKYHFLDQENLIAWLKQDLFRLDVPLQDLSKLEEILPQLLDQEIQIKIQTKESNGRSYRNLYFQKALSNSPQAMPKKQEQPTAPWMTNHQNQFPF
ncbi:DUF669 domain-containing protein [Thermoactinomyces sp. DSM 45892]|uniref:DUF669 domain-containing protein n=1 Tax=Thermoactinomyces sp. DSM 45892 TaxID=1882753 RepID=UPI0008998F68|nr:DUF669 domain-containing protein [Thermoactinomyces sp. DSM 45892]SDY22428.1 Protein of unknown function [Thermoactinomyces sp. DSM 45892]